MKSEIQHRYNGKVLKRRSKRPDRKRVGSTGWVTFNQKQSCWKSRMDETESAGRTFVPYINRPRILRKVKERASMISLSQFLMELKALGLARTDPELRTPLPLDGPTEKYRKHRKTRNKMARRSRRINRLRT